MPNYLYRCCECKQVIELTLPLSSDPKELYTCECGYTMNRIMRPFGAVIGFKTFAGDWYKKTYGRDIAAPYEDAKQRKEDETRMKKELDKLTGGS